MPSFAYYRLPGKRSYVRLFREGAVGTLPSVEEADGRAGFLIAPFTPNETTPIVLLEPEEVWEGVVPEGTTFVLPAARRSENRETYGQAFRAMQQVLRTGQCDKVVLARTATMPIPPLSNEALERFFFAACAAHPHAFVSLFQTPQTGCWLVATPERLLTYENGAWQTMALAGTMACADGACVPLDAWSEKNRREQRLVAQYVRDQLRQLGVEPEESETYVRKVGAICHLETDFRFLLPAGLGIGTVLSHLHPTPAVCGVPTERARRAILACEPEPRRYYAGFCGPLNLLHETRLYVNLRCLEVMPSLLRFHAGGGLLPESNEEDEWQETQRKMAAPLERITEPTSVVLPGEKPCAV